MSTIVFLLFFLGNQAVTSMLQGIKIDPVLLFCFTLVPDVLFRLIDRVKNDICWMVL